MLGIEVSYTDNVNISLQAIIVLKGYQQATRNKIVFYPFHEISVIFLKLRKKGIGDGILKHPYKLQTLIGGDYTECNGFKPI